MKKIFFIGWKDLLITFRDRGALIMMLAAPLALTLAMGFATGILTGDSNGGVSDIPVIIVNQDEGQLGDSLIDYMTGPDLVDLLAVAESPDAALARQQAEEDEIAAVIIVPSGFSASIIPDPATGQTGDVVEIEIYASPLRPISANIIESIVTGFVNRIDVSVVSTEVAIGQLVSSGLLSVSEITAAGPAIAQRQLAGEPSQLIAIQRSDIEQEEDLASTDALAWFATGMAVFFLMYTVSIGGRSILDEQNKGTLSRMLTTPSSTTQVLGGKVTGIFMNGTAQVSLLIIATSLLFGMRWGDPLAVASLIVAVVAAATGWGILLASFAKEPAQVSSLGTAMMLIFGVLGGTFGNFVQSGSPLAFLSKMTPNAWALDGFYSLAQGGTMNDILGSLVALLVMAAILFGVSIIVFRRRWGTVA